MISILTIGGLFSFFGVQKITKALAPALRADTVSNGAGTFWSIIELQETTIVIYTFRGVNFHISVGVIGLAIYAIGFLGLIGLILYRQNLLQVFGQNTEKSLEGEGSEKQNPGSIM